MIRGVYFDLKLEFSFRHSQGTWHYHALNYNKQWCWGNNMITWHCISACLYSTDWSFVYFKANILLLSYRAKRGTKGIFLALESYNCSDTFLIKVQVTELFCEHVHYFLQCASCQVKLYLLIYIYLTFCLALFEWCRSWQISWTGDFVTGKDKTCQICKKWSVKKNKSTNLRKATLE